MSNILRNSTRLILCEGMDEKQLIESLIRRARLPEADVLPAEGSGDLGSQLRAAIKTPGPAPITAIGLVRDAEDNADRACQSSRDILTAAGFASPHDSHAVRQSGAIKCGFAVEPHGEHMGSIEDICLRSSEGWPLMACVEEFMECSRRAVGRDYKSRVVENKVRVQILLAGAHRERAIHRAGLGAAHGVFDLGHIAFEPLSAFLAELLG